MSDEKNASPTSLEILIWRGMDANPVRWYLIARSHTHWLFAFLLTWPKSSSQSGLARRCSVFIAEASDRIVKKLQGESWRDLSRKSP